MTEFDVDKFKKANFGDRTKDIDVTDPDLLKFFAANGKKSPKKAVWTVKALGAEECARANAAKNNYRNVAELASKLSAAVEGKKGGEDVADPILSLIGLGKEDLPTDYVYRLELFAMGSLKPAIDKRTAVLMAKRKPEFFYKVTNEILSLIGEGQSLGE